MPLPITGSASKPAIHNILVIGDSISAGFGLRKDTSWVNLLQKRIDIKRYPYNVINASISGDTTGGGSKRILKSLKNHQPALVIIELGGNDGLRGFSLKKIQKNLETMIDTSLSRGHKVLLIGMQLPPNYGLAYTKRFSHIYQTLAKNKKVSLVPFLFNGFAENSQHFQSDQIHPNEGAQILILNNIWPVLEPLL